MEGLETIIGVPGPVLDMMTSACLERASKRRVSENTFSALRAAFAWSLFSSASTSTRASRKIRGSSSFRLELFPFLGFRLLLVFDESKGPPRGMAETGAFWEELSKWNMMAKCRQTFETYSSFGSTKSGSELAAMIVIRRILNTDFSAMSCVLVFTPKSVCKEIL